jgi:hypothetical protein
MPTSHPRRIFRGRVAPVLAAMLLLGVFHQAFAQADTDVVAQRGDAKLTVADVREMIDHMDAASRAQVQGNPVALANVVRQRLLNQVLLADAKAKGFDQLQDVMARANEARDSVIIASYVASLVPPDPNFPSPADIAATYEANKAKFVQPKRYHLAQIVFPLAADATPAQEEEAKKRALDAHAQAVKPKADFAELARKLSLERNTGSNGGDLGWVRDDQLQPALRSVVANLPENGISEAVRAPAPAGWIVFKVLGIRPAGPPALAEIQDQLVAAMRQARSQQGSQAYINEMLRAQPIQLNEIDLEKRLAAPH